MDSTNAHRCRRYQLNSGRQAHVAKERRPNLGGLFDMYAGGPEMGSGRYLL